MADDLTLAETARAMRRNVELVRQWVKTGRLPARKRGFMWFIRARDLARFVKDEPVRRPRGRKRK